MLISKGGIMTIAIAKHSQHSLVDIVLAFAVGVVLATIVMLLVNYAPAELSQLEFEKLGQSNLVSLGGINFAP